MSIFCFRGVGRSLWSRRNGDLCSAKKGMVKWLPIRLEMALLEYIYHTEPKKDPSRSPTCSVFLQRRSIITTHLPTSDLLHSSHRRTIVRLGAREDRLK